MLKIENTSEYNKTTDWQVSKNLIIQRGIYNEVEGKKRSPWISCIKDSGKSGWEV